MTKIASFCFFTLFFLLIFGPTHPATAQDNYRAYRNARFGYQLQYPANLVAPQPESDNGDGRKFLSRDGQIELTVYASNNSLGRSLPAQMNASASEWKGQGARLTYRKTGSGWFALSGFVGDDIFYEKTLFRGDAFHTLLWQYPKSLRKRLDGPVTRSVNTFFVNTKTRPLPARPVQKPQVRPQISPIVSRPTPNKTRAPLHSGGY